MSIQSRTLNAPAVGIGRIERHHVVPERCLPKGLDHGADFPGGIEHHGCAAPGEHGGDADGGGLEPAGSTEDQGMGGSAAARIDQQRRGAALAPGASVCWIEGAACDAIPIDPVGLTDNDAAMGLIRTGEQPAGVADGEPIGVAEIVGPSTHQARSGSAAQGLLERQTNTGDSSDQADGGCLHSAEIEGAQDIQQRRAADDTVPGADTPARRSAPSPQRRRRYRQAA